MTVDGDTYLVLARDVQMNPITDQVLHADFLRVTPKTKINVAVPVEYVNEAGSPGLKEGGVLNIIRFDVELTCRATSIPDKIEVDLEGLEIGDSLKISSVTLPEGTSPAITDRDFNLATIAAPRVLVEEEPTEEDAEGEEGAEGAAEGEGAEAAAEGDAAEGGEAKEEASE